MLNKKFWTMTERQLCDCEMILDGSFHPLDRFMTKKDYDEVLKTMRLENGELFPIPVVLDVNEEFSKTLELGEQIALRDKEGFVISLITLSSIWKPDVKKEAELIYGTLDTKHPAVNFLFNSSGRVYLGGKKKK